MKRIVLASGSPRRKDILEMLKLPFEVIKSDAEEKVPEGISPEETVKILSELKAEAVAENLEGDLAVIGSDTVVYLDGKILGKPEDEKDAYNMLKSLSGKTHFVYTGITVLFKDGEKTRKVTVSDKTKVTFKSFSEKDILDYIASKEPFGKAGAYAVQGMGGMFIEKIEGDFFTVVGMSPRVLSEILSSEGIYISDFWK